MSNFVSNDVFCLALTRTQLEFLSDPKYCGRRMQIFAALISMTSESDSLSTKRGINIPVSIGKAEISEVNLAAHLGWNRKTVSDYIKAFNEVGLIKTVKDNKSSIHSILTLSEWLHGSNMIRNPLYHHPTDKPSASCLAKPVTSISESTEAPSVGSSPKDIPAQILVLSAPYRDFSESSESADGTATEQTSYLPEDQPSVSNTEG